MSAILSADDLNDFISPGVACIKPVETLPRQRPEPTNPWEVTTEDKVTTSADAAPAQISLTDCLACSGCVTSAEAILVSLQSHQEVLNTLDAHLSLSIPDLLNLQDGAKVFVASVSPQTRASIAATYNVTEKEAGYMIEQLLSGKAGLKSGGKNSNGFTWVVDTNALRSLCHAAVLKEVEGAASSMSKGGPALPILASACPGWICYAEKTHPHILPHLSRVKSPQALAGTLLKAALSRVLGVSPDRIWHLAIMPCFDKKLEASREELTDRFWAPDVDLASGVRDVDCVITAREVIMLADTRGIRFPDLPRTPVTFPDFPDTKLSSLIRSKPSSDAQTNLPDAGPSGGYAYFIVKAQQDRLPGSELKIEVGRNVDVVDYTLVHNGRVVMKTGRYNGFRNITNLVRKLKPQKASKMPGAKLAGGANRRAVNGSAPTGSASGMAEYAYIEVMACPGGCTNGGGQIKAEDVAVFNGGANAEKLGPAEQKAWLAKVDEAYFSADSSSEDESHYGDTAKTGGFDGSDKTVFAWSSLTNVDATKLLYTTYRQVESDVGKNKGASDMERVTAVANSLGGGW